MPNETHLGLLWVSSFMPRPQSYISFFVRMMTVTMGASKRFARVLPFVLAVGLRRFQMGPLSGKIGRLTE